jgi:transcriptional regulator with XRE-family HTH domain
MNFQKRLTELRKANKLSQEELAKSIGVHTNILGRYERDEVKPSIDVVIKIAEVFNVSIDYLVGKIDNELDKDIINKVMTIQKLPDTDKQHIMFTLDAMLRDAKARTAYTSV